MRKDSLERFDYEAEEPQATDRIPQDLRLDAQMTEPAKRQHARLTNGLFAIIMLVVVILLISGLVSGMMMLLTAGVVIAIVDVAWGIWLIR
ncbi:MAG TPA: hypothetical protein DCW31_00885 [Lactobacillus sp.]|nr:hypothetical protein [Lactobacillus sp.]